MNITENKDGYVFEAEMPGVNKDGLEVLLENNDLTIMGRRQTATVRGELLYRASSRQDFRRVFVLDPTIDTQKITVNIEEGVLRLVLPKAERVKPRKIQVTNSTLNKIIDNIPRRQCAARDF